MSRNLRPDELAAIIGLDAGDLEPLADLLESGRKTIDPIVQRSLWKAIRGSKADSDYRLVFDKHPELKHSHQGSRAARLRDRDKLNTALVMKKHGALKVGQHESAVIATADELGKGKSTVKSHWSSKQRLIRFCIAHDIINDSD